MTDRTIIVGEDVNVGERDVTNFVRAYIKGYRFLHGNRNPRKITIPKVLFVEDMLIEYQDMKQEPKPTTKLMIKDGKDAKPK